MADFTETTGTAEAPRRGRGRPPRAAATMGDYEAIGEYTALTPREIDMVRLAITGATERAIALRLGISQNTVHHALLLIYRKLQVPCRSSMVAAVICQGVISLDETRELIASTQQSYRLSGQME